MGFERSLVRKESRSSGKGGLSFVVEAMEHFGIKRIVESKMPVHSNRSIEAWEKVVVGVLLHLSGGDCVEDIGVLRADTGLLRTIGRKLLPSPDTYLNFLQDKRTSAQIRQVIQAMVVKVMKESKETVFTYDNDATYFNSDKKSAAYSYQKEKQFSALLGVVPELSGLCITMDYRPGNVSPAKGILNQLRKAVMLSKKAEKRIGRFRSDSAAHNMEIMTYCDQNEIKFFISLDRNEVTLKEAKGIDEKRWKKHPSRDGVEWAEGSYAMCKSKKDKIAMRTLILRWEDPNPDLFSTGYRYHIIATNDWKIEPMDWLKVHNGRMGSENVHKELKTGFSASYTPSHSFNKNRGFFIMATLAYNVAQLFKLFYLGKQCIKWTIKTLRFRFINTVISLSSHARRKVCYLINISESQMKYFRSCQARWLSC